jgi:DNA polymerase elongation subunit (family B)
MVRGINLMSKQPIKRLFFDIEISPCSGWFWRTGKQVVTYKQVLDENRIICLAYKEQYSKKTECLYWDDAQSDQALVKQFQDIAKDYDVIVGQNSDNFDIKHVAARLAKFDETPLQISVAEDTYKQAKRHLNLPSYSLDYLGGYFGVGNKLATGGVDLWLDVWLKNDRKKLLKMGKYCKQDVVLCEAVYNKIYPYVDHKTNLATYKEDRSSCPNCGEQSLVIDGYRYTRTGKKVRYRCNNCFRYCTIGKNLIANSSEYPR